MTGGPEGWAVLAAGGAGTALLALAVAAGLPGVVPAAVALLGAAYALLLVLRDPALDVRAPLVAAGLLAAAELAYWSLELRAGIAEDAGALARRVALLLLLALAGMLLGALVLAVAGELGTGALWLEALGAAAAVAVLALVLGAVRLRRG